tara:strand:- start:109 stop:429 length:321 start_codon:yes stop_codon:yes gene_type:complete
MKALSTILKVSIQNLIIVTAWLFLAPFFAMVINPLPWWLFGIIFIAISTIYFLLLFFSNAELFRWAKNDYVWSLCTGIFTLFVFVIPSMMWVSHANIYSVIKSAFT